MEPKSQDRTCPRCGALIAPSAAEGWCTRCLLEGAAVVTDGPGSARGRVDAPSVAAIAAAFPQLEVVELLGAGGMGAVYKARQARLDRWVALKVLPAELGREPAFAERFLREARVLARLNHPNIVAVHDFGQAGDFCYLLMEYVDGVNLRQAMRAGRFRPAQALELVPQICAALQFAHDSGVMHRDIKPENILLDARGRVRLVDFGIAKLLGSSGRDPVLTVTGATVGTPQYMAPEQIERPSDVDHRADIYSLGVVFYELLTGELPLGRFAAPSDKAALDTRIDEIVMRALAKERELRQQSANEVRSAVEAVGDGRPKAVRGANAERETASGSGLEIVPPPAPLWTQSMRYRVWAMVLLWAGAAADGYLLWPALRNLAKMLNFDLLAANHYAIGMAIGWVLVVMGGIQVVVGAPIWLGPLRYPPGSEGFGLNRAVWWGTLMSMAVFGMECAVSTILAAGAVAGFLGTAIERQALMVPTVWGAFSLVAFPSLLWIGWIRGMRVARQPQTTTAAQPQWGLGFALALLALGTGSTLLVAWQRTLVDAPEQFVVSTSWSAMLPVVLAWWTRSRFWRALALLLAPYAAILGMLSSAVLLPVGIHVLWSAPEAVAIVADAWPSLFAATLGMTVVQFLAWYGLSCREARWAFGCEGPVNRDDASASAKAEAGPVGRHGTDSAAA